jgi:hypothetical protein
MQAKFRFEGSELASMGMQGDQAQLAALACEDESVLTEAPEEVESWRGTGSPRFAEVHRAQTAKLLALLSFTALCAIFLAHFVSIYLLAHTKADAIEEVTRVFSTWVRFSLGL